jgi:hypothetical protein
LHEFLSSEKRAPSHWVISRSSSKRNLPLFKHLNCTAKPRQLLQCLWESVTKASRSNCPPQPMLKHITARLQRWRKKSLEKDKVGFVKELIIGLGLRVQHVFERNVALYLNDKARGDSLTWPGPESWNDVHIPASALRDVDFFIIPPYLYDWHWT